MKNLENILKRLSRRKACRAKCLDCTGGHTGEISRCHCLNCPLYEFRTGKGKQDARQRQKAIKKYCFWCMGGSKGEVDKCPSTHCPLYPYRKGGVERPSENTRICTKEAI